MERLIPVEEIAQSIFLIRGQKVMLDMVLARLYGVETKALNRAIRRNKERFPADFIFQLTAAEAKNLRCHFGTSSLQSPFQAVVNWGGRRYLPYVFTEQGVAMLSSVLKSKRAALVNVAIMRAFVRLRRLIGSHKTLAKKMAELEKKVGTHDKAINSLFAAIYDMMNPEEKERKAIGFRHPHRDFKN